MWVAWESPAGWFRRGFRCLADVVVVRLRCLFCGLFVVFGDRGLRGGLVNDAFAGGESGDECGDGEVVDRAWVAACAVVDGGDRVLGEERVGPACVGQVSADVLGGFCACHAVDLEAGRDSLVKGGEHGEFESATQGGLADQQQSEVGAGIHL